MNTPTTVELKILNQRISLRTSDNDPEFTAEVVDLVSSLIEKSENRMKTNRVPSQVMVLAMLELAEEYVRAKKRTGDYKAEVARRAEQIVRSFDHSSESSPQKK